MPALHPHLNPDLTFNLDAIDASARREADALSLMRPIRGVSLTWQGIYKSEIARLRETADAHRALVLWSRERDADLAHRAAMSTRERRILELREAAHLARMIDDTAEAIATQEGAERALAELLAEVE